MSLLKRFQPQILQIRLPVATMSLFDSVRKELDAKATADANHCYGFFPGMKKDTIDDDLPMCRSLASKQPVITLDDKTLGFNFVRLSQIRQTGDSPYHLDSDAKTALTGDTTTISDRLVWRFLLNISTEHPRTLGYLDADPFSLPLETGGGYIHCPNKAITSSMKKTIVIPSRKDGTISGLLFCASRVLHTGKDDQFGHFVAGYGMEE